jgi:hypothetical protein
MIISCLKYNYITRVIERLGDAVLKLQRRLARRVSVSNLVEVEVAHGGGGGGDKAGGAMHDQPGVEREERRCVVDFIIIVHHCL